MDETLIQKGISGGLEEEGAECLWQSELGWADYLDKKADSSYAMNERPSKASDGYYTPDVFSNPMDIAKSWVESMKGVIADPLEAGFMTISNDRSGNRSYPKGATEVDARTIKPKIKNFDPKKRNAVPGFNVFGTPGTKIDLPGGFGTGKKGFFGTEKIAEKVTETLPEEVVQFVERPFRNVKVPDLPQLPKVDLPKVDLPKVDLPKIDLPKVDLPKFGKD
jgi:hypothetical protein